MCVEMSSRKGQLCLSHTPIPINKNLPTRRIQSTVIEALESLFACAGELEALSRDELCRCRLSELVQIEGARREFAHFRHTFHLEIIRLRKSLDAALAFVERGRVEPSYIEGLQDDSRQHSPVWRLHAAPPRRRTRF